MNPLLEAALARAREGVCVLPLWWTDGQGVCRCPLGASCPSPGKHPLTSHGFDDATSDPLTIQLRWRELRSIELVLEEVAGEFDGESPTRPWEREALDDGKKRLEELHRAAQAYVGPFKLPGPDKEEMEQVREVIRREGEG